MTDITKNGYSTHIFFCIDKANVITKCSVWMDPNRQNQVHASFRRHYHVVTIAGNNIVALLRDF